MNQVNPAEIRILVVDDDADILNGTARLLENAGYAVDRAATGEEALQAVRDRRPDLLLLDRNLPGIDGIEVCRRIKGDPAQTDILVVMASASYAKSDEQAEGLESGADGYITRPITNRELLARVESYVRIVRLTRSLRLQAEELKQSNEAAGMGQLASLNLMEDAVAARERAEQASQALRKSRDLLVKLTAQVPGMVFQYQLHPDGHASIPLSNPAINVIYEVPPEEVREDATPVHRRHHPDDYDRIVAAIQESARTQQPFQCEFRVVLPKQGLRWRLCDSLPERMEDGSTLWHGIVSDITERKRDELRIATFASLGQRLSAAKTAKEAGEIIVEVADNLLGWDSCVFHLYSAPENRVTHLLRMDLIDGRRTECELLPVDRPPTEFARRAIEQGGQLILRDPARAEQSESLPFGDKSRLSASIMFVPIRHGTEVVGVLSIQSYTPSAYDAHSLETLQALADHGGGALGRLRAQQTLLESEAVFRSVWEHSIDGMWLTDKDGRIISVNDAFCGLVKLPREKLEGQILSVAYMPHDPNGDIDVYRKQFATGNIVPRITTLAQLWNGEETNLEISNSFVQPGQRGKMLLSVFRDVSERKRAELQIEAFSQLGEKLSAARIPAEAARAIYASADLFWKWDSGMLDIESAEPGWIETVLAYDVMDGERREVTTQEPICPASARNRRVMAQGAQLILRTPTEPPSDDSLRFGDVFRFSASIMCVPVRVEGRVVGALSIQSYTPDAYTQADLQTLQALADHCGGALDRLRMEAAWRTTQYRLGHLLTQSPAVIYSLKTDGKTTEPTWISDNVERLLGYTVAECNGPQGLFDRVRPANGPSVTDGLDRLIAEKQIARDYQVQHKNRGLRWVRDEQRLVCDPQGAPVEIVGSWVDITERKTVEEQLRQSQKMEAVGQLAGGVAHDFNNMLAVIRGNAELLLMDEEHCPVEVREGLAQVLEASDQAANLTFQLLAFSRKHVLQPEPLMLNDVVVNLIKMLKRLIGENIDLQCHYAASLPHVHADPGMMGQVLLNLVVNARDAMPEGGQLRVATEQIRLDKARAELNPEARAGEFVCVKVSDTGTGIAPEILPHIFEPFFTTKEIGKGTGLGLATVYGIVQQHQGWVEVASQVGSGTTFKVCLPAIPSSALLVAPSEVGADVRGGEETILLVEDNHSVRMTLRRVLESKGYKVCEAANGREALEVWQLHAAQIALLLTDIIMPEGMTGRELAERLRGHRPGLKVIIMSGHSSDILGHDTDFIRRTKSPFLQKPCSARVLLETVRRCLDET